MIAAVQENARRLLDAADDGQVQRLLDESGIDFTTLVEQLKSLPIMKPAK